jgi:hypothetical protein
MEVIVAHCSRTYTKLTQGQKRAASEADVAWFKRRMGVDAMQACMDPSVCPQYDLQYQVCNCFTSGTSEDGVRYVTCVLEKERKDFGHIWMPPRLA